MHSDAEKWWSSGRLISVIVDNDSWIIPYAKQLQELINNQGRDQARFYRNHDEIDDGDIAFYLGCTQIVTPDILAKHRFNLVVHESDLPQGRGLAPLTWQILEGKNTIKVCLIEAADKIDAGDIYLSEELHFNGDELNAELRNAQGEITIELCMSFLNASSVPNGRPQTGEPTYYSARNPGMSEMDVDKTIREQFNLLRVVDNVRYPAFFEMNGIRYRLKIEKEI